MTILVVIFTVRVKGNNPPLFCQTGIMMMMMLMNLKSMTVTIKQLFAKEQDWTLHLSILLIKMTVRMITWRSWGNTCVKNPTFVCWIFIISTSWLPRVMASKSSALLNWETTRHLNWVYLPDQKIQPSVPAGSNWILSYFCGDHGSTLGLIIVIWKVTVAHFTLNKKRCKSSLALTSYLLTRPFFSKWNVMLMMVALTPPSLV